RFKSGDSPTSMVVRAVTALLWFPISYVARIYTVVLIEPMFNPLKLPVAILAAKFLYPFFWPLTELLSEPLIPLVGPSVAGGFAFATVWLLPDAFGFLFWEMKENWSLYRANRSKALRPVVIGQHGENLLQMLRPGFHSGTLPRLYTQLRRAEF